MIVRGQVCVDIPVDLCYYVTAAQNGSVLRKELVKQ